MDNEGEGSITGKVTKSHHRAEVGLSLIPSRPSPNVKEIILFVLLYKGTGPLEIMASTLVTPDEWRWRHTYSGYCNSTF